MSRNATTASSSYSMSAGLSRAMMRQKTQSVTAPPRRPVIIPACRPETTREGAPDGNVSEVQAQDPKERQPREARVDVVPQGVSRSFRLAGPSDGSGSRRLRETLTAALPALSTPVGDRDVLHRGPRARRLGKEAHELVDLLGHLRAHGQPEHLRLLRGDRIVVGPAPVRACRRGRPPPRAPSGRPGARARSPAPLLEVDEKPQPSHLQ